MFPFGGGGGGEGGNTTTNRNVLWLLVSTYSCFWLDVMWVGNLTFVSNL